MLDARAGFAWLGFGEEAEGDGVGEDALDDFEREGGVFCDFFIGGGAVERDSGPEVEVV